MQDSQGILNPIQRNKKTNKFDREFNKYIHHISNNGFPDSDSLGEDQEHELEYMRSHRVRFKYIYRMLPDEKANLKVLDIGTTPFTILLKNIYDSYDIYTIDYSDLFKRRCEEKGINFNNHDLSSGPIPFEQNKFDIVIFTEVLEHILTPPTVLFKELYRIIRTGGQLIFGTPNFARLKNRIKLARGISPLEQFHPDSTHGHGHVREYTMNECLNIMNKVGFNVSKREFINGKSPQHFIKRKKDVFELPVYLSIILITIYYALTMAIPSLRHFIYIDSHK